MMKKWIQALVFLAPVILLVAGLNYMIDPGNLFRNAAEQLAALELEGKDAYVVSGNLEERDVAEHLIVGMEEPAEVIAVGPSLVRWVNSDMVKSDSFYNLGVSSGMGYDILAIIGELIRYDKLPEKMLFCVDSLFFDQTLMDAHPEYWQERKDDARYCLESIGAEIPQQISNGSSDWINHLIKYRQLLSVTYFQSSVEYVSLNGIQTPQMVGEVYAGYEGAYYLKDNARVSNTAVRNISAEEVAADIQEYISDHAENSSRSTLDNAITPGEHMDQEMKEIFSDLIGYLVDEGVEIKFFFHPFPQQVWDYMEETGNYPLVRETEELGRGVAEAYNIEVIGSYNPYDIGCTTEDFQDYRHLKPEALIKYFDFSF